MRPSSHFIGGGDLLRSETGRPLSPAPKVNFRTDAATHATIRRRNEWLAREATAEAEANPHRWLRPHFDPRMMSDADIASANLILFDDEDGPADRHWVKPIIVNGEKVDTETR